MRLSSMLPTRPPMWLIVAVVVAVVGVACFGQRGGDKANQPPKTPAADAKQPTETANGQKVKTVLKQEKMTLFELLLKGRWFMIPLGLCSLLGLSLIIERLAALRRKAVVPPSFLNELKQIFHHTHDDREKGLAFCRERDCPIGRVLAAGIAKLRKGEEIVERAIEDAAAAEILKLRRNLQMLFAVAAVAPMLGLLGTVWGMIQAFQSAALGQLGQIGKAEGLARGIYEALVTTFVGLTIAIPVLMFYYYFRGKIERIISGLNEVSIEFVDHYLAEEEALHPPTAAAAPGPPAVPRADVIEFQCDNCQATLRVPADRAGKKGSCKKCGTIVTVPAAG